MLMFFNFGGMRSLLAAWLHFPGFDFLLKRLAFPISVLSHRKLRCRCFCFAWFYRSLRCATESRSPG